MTASLSVEVAIQDLVFGQDHTQDQVCSSGSEPVPNFPAHPPISEAVWQQWLTQWLTHQQADLPQHSSYELTLRLTTDAEIQELNAQYRHRDQPTDVLAFAALESEDPNLDDPELADLARSQPLYLGDIVISVETAQQQAIQQGHSLPQELAWLASHGLLHLLGWDHPDGDRLAEMLHQQEILLTQVGLVIDDAARIEIA